MNYYSAVYALVLAILVALGSHAYAQITFTSTDYPVGDIPRGIVTGDFNRDGIRDVVVTNYSDAVVAVLLGNSFPGTSTWNGTFAGPTTFTAGTLNCFSVTTGDFNEDGFTDLVTANASQFQIGTLLGNGDGTFGPVMNQSPGNFPLYVLPVDINFDDITDLIVANSGEETMSVLFGNSSATPGVGDGTFQFFMDSPTGGRGLGKFAVEDFNSDGFLDIAIGKGSSDDFSIMLGNEALDEEEMGLGVPDGTFTVTNTYNTTEGGSGLTSEDFNGDGVLDIAILSRVIGNSDSQVEIFTGNADPESGLGDGTFATPPLIYRTGGRIAVDLIAADLNNDDILDLAMTNRDSDNIGILLGNGSGGIGNGTFSSVTNYPAGESPYFLTTDDFNADGKLDIVCTNQDSSNMTVFINEGAPEPEIDIINNLPGLIFDFDQAELGDINGSEFVAMISNTGNADLILSATLTNDANGAFSVDGFTSLASSLNAKGSTAAGPFTVDSNTTASLEVSFTPQVVGEVTGTLALDTNTTSGTLVFDLVGTGNDTTPPQSEVTGPDGTLTQASPIISVSYSAQDTTPGSGVSEVELFYNKDNTGYNSAGIFTQSPISFDTELTGRDGTYQLYTIARDNSDNEEEAPQEPDVTIQFNDTTFGVDSDLIMTY